MKSVDHWHRFYCDIGSLTLLNSVRDSIHLLHPAAKVVLHLHVPYSTALTAIECGRLQMIHQNAARFFGEIAYDDHINGIAEAMQEGERDGQILLLATHGVVVTRCRAGT